MTTTSLTKDARSSMMELCTSIVTKINEVQEKLPEVDGYSLEESEIPVVMACVETAKKAGQVKGSRMTWLHKGQWLVFRRRGSDLSCTISNSKPEWIQEPPKVKWVPMLVPQEMKAEIAAFISSKQRGEQ